MTIRPAETHWVINIAIHFELPVTRILVSLLLKPWYKITLLLKQKAYKNQYTQYAYYREKLIFENVERIGKTPPQYGT